MQVTFEEEEEVNLKEVQENIVRLEKELHVVQKDLSSALKELGYDS